MKTQRKPIPRLSEKRSKSGKPYLKRSAIKRKHRKPSEFKRIYGSRGRVAWMKQQTCVACRQSQRCEVAHIVTGGMGRKAGFEQTVPLCGRSAYRPGCHAALHMGGRIWFEKTYHISLSTEASRVQKAFEALQGGGA